MHAYICCDGVQLLHELLSISSRVTVELVRGLPVLSD